MSETIMLLTRSLQVVRQQMKNTFYLCINVFIYKQYYTFAPCKDYLSTSDISVPIGQLKKLKVEANIVCFDIK